MRLPPSMMLDLTDPVPTVFRRPVPTPPPPPGDLEWDAMLEALKDKPLPKRKSAELKWNSPGTYPTKVGDYVSSRVKNKNWVRHWNGSWWSNGWLIDRPEDRHKKVRESGSMQGNQYWIDQDPATL